MSKLREAMDGLSHHVRDMQECGECSANLEVLEQAVESLEYLHDTGIYNVVSIMSDMSADHAARLRGLCADEGVVDHGE